MRRFIALPSALYRNEPHWIAPLDMDMRKRLNRERNPFFKHAEAEYLIAWRDGQPVGRISAHIDHRFNEFQDNRWGLFGFFECEDSIETAHALLGAAERWLRERARDLMEKLLSVASPLGLYAEEFDTSTGRHLGNFPQAFSHLALIEAAGRIILAERIEELS